MILIPHNLTREFIQANSHLIFVYPAYALSGVTPAERMCCDLPNCFGVPTGWRACKSSGYFQDSQYDLVKDEIEEWIADIPRDKPIIPFYRIGKENSQMSYLSPRCYEYLITQLDRIKSPNIKYTF